VVIFEVGLGGRLDAVNMVDADISLITSIDLDHTDWLGDTREAIAIEKAGIMRAGAMTVCSDPNPPHTIKLAAETVGSTLLQLGRDYSWWSLDKSQSNQWNVEIDNQLIALPKLALKGAKQRNNAAGVVAVVQQLQHYLKVSDNALRSGLKEARLMGRWQEITPSAAGPKLIFDVAHNRDSAKLLAENLKQHPITGKRIAVIAMLVDKDRAGVIVELSGLFSQWIVTGLDVSRGDDGDSLMTLVSELGEQAILERTPIDGWKRATEMASVGDEVVIFGSFYTVAAVLEQL
jgi:dihydrofolate synthase / folylpolyglutamate synthase